MDDLAVGVLDAQGIIDPVGDSGGEVRAVGKLFVTDRLDDRILGGVDSKPACIDRLVCLLIGISLLIHQILQHLVDQGILIPGVDGGCFALQCFIGLNAGVHILVRQGFLIAFPENIVLRIHAIQNSPAAGTVALRVCQRVIAGGILRNGRDHGAFGKRQLGNILAEILKGSCLNTITAGSQIDRIQVIFQDLILSQELFQLQCQILFLDFADQPLPEGGFAGPAGEDGIFQQLLRDGAGAFRE